MLKIYTTSTCGVCKMIKSFLKDKNIKYKEYDVGTDEKARLEMTAKSGQYEVPVIEANGKILSGFNLTELEKMAKDERIKNSAAAGQTNGKKQKTLKSAKLIKRSFSKTKK